VIPFSLVGWRLRDMGPRGAPTLKDLLHMTVAVGTTINLQPCWPPSYMPIDRRLFYTHLGAMFSRRGAYAAVQGPIGQDHVDGQSHSWGWGARSAATCRTGLCWLPAKHQSCS